MNYSLKNLENKKTIYAGQFDDLKIETASKRVWLSRMTVDDGAEYNNMVTIEELKTGGGKPSINMRRNK